MPRTSPATAPIVTLLAIAYGTAHAQPIQIGSRLELFLDDYLIEQFEGGARLRLHHPVRKEIALEHDAPWEGRGSGYHTVFRDGERFRLYYKSWNMPEVTGKAGGLVIAYAESRDGIRWTKPDLGLVEYNGSRKNNIILDKVNGNEPHDFSPFIDPKPGTAGDARYKAVGFGRTPRGLYAFKSADGLHWTLMKPTPIITQGAFDTQNIAFWDPNIRKYRCYLRDFDANKQRGIRTSVSDDFLTWSKPEWIVFPNTPVEQLYVNQVLPYYRAPHILIGFPARYVDRGWTESAKLLPELADREERAKKNTRYGTTVTDSLIMSSRDGRTFHRWDQAFLRPGLRTRYNWSYGDNYIAWHVIETEPTNDDEPRELSLFATEGYFTGDSSRLRRYTMRIDGFASAFAPLGGGTIVSKPVVFDGNQLVVNFSTAAGGSIRLALEDAAGKPIDGYTMNEATEIFGDALERTVSWKGGSDVGKVAGKPVRIRVALKDADLFSFRFVRK
ncbi:MAG: hypothetical protein ACKV22_16970 [Bryobacteraceae bacterium]